MRVDGYGYGHRCAFFVYTARYTPSILDSVLPAFRCFYGPVRKALAFDHLRNLGYNVILLFIHCLEPSGERIGNETQKNGHSRRVQAHDAQHTRCASICNACAHRCEVGAMAWPGIVAATS